MKIVRESLNEISKGKTSGISSLGIGSTSMCKGYNIASKLDPKINRILPLDSKIWKWEEGPLKNFPSKMEEVLGVSTSKIVFIDKDRVTPQAEEFIRMTVFHDVFDSTKYEAAGLRKDYMQVLWPDQNPTKMSIYTNEKYGISFATYYQPSGAPAKQYYCFRTS